MPSVPDVQSQIENISGLPSLTLPDDPGAATRFNPSLANNLGQLAWNYGALVPVGAAAAGLWYLNNNRKKKKQQQPSAEPVLKMAAETPQASLLETIRHHLPKLRVPDTAVGLAAGGGAGLLWDLIRGSGRDEQGNKKPSKRLQRVLTGALAGAGLSNLAGDRFRRYIVNTTYPTSYGNQPRQIIPGTRFDPATGTELTGDGGKDIATKDVLGDLWRGAVLDKPNYKVAPRFATSSIADHTLSARRELMRRAFGLPIDLDQKDNPYWQKRPGGYYSLNEKSPEYATRLRALFGPTKPVFTTTGSQGMPGHAELLKRPQRVLTQLNTARDFMDEERNVDFSLFGGPQINGVQQLPFKEMSDGSIAGTALDRWDLTLSGKEQQVFSDGMKSFREGGVSGARKWLDAPLQQRLSKYLGPTTHTNRNALKTLAGRAAWDKILTDEHPWVQQKFQLTKSPARSWGEWFSSDNSTNTDAAASPYQLQFLRDDNTPAMDAMTNKSLRSWTEANPVPPLNRIPRVVDNLKPGQDKQF